MEKKHQYRGLTKQEVEEIVEFLKEPQKYTDLGGKIPRPRKLRYGANSWRNSKILLFVYY